MRQYIIYFAALLVAGCSGDGFSAVAPKSAPPQDVARNHSQHIGLTDIQYSCPATGPIVYVSDYTNSVINVYKGDLKSQLPCGQLGSRSTLSGPSGLYVQTATHDLYVANGGISSIAVFHRGHNNPYNSYLDRSHGYVHFQDVTVAKDGTLIANSDCSLSTWILGPNGGTLGTLVERTTRFTMLLHLPRLEGYGVEPRVKNGPALGGYGAEAMKDAITARISTLPEQLLRSLTWDRGKELSQHVQLKIDTGLAVYFADPHSPWQRGTNENTNGLLRQYFPKGTDLSRWDAKEIEAVAATLNSRPRKALGWKMPAEALNEHLLSVQ